MCRVGQWWRCDVRKTALTQPGSTAKARLAGLQTWGLLVWNVMHPSFSFLVVCLGNQLIKRVDLLTGNPQTPIDAMMKCWVIEQTCPVCFWWIQQRLKESQMVIKCCCCSLFDWGLREHIWQPILGWSFQNPGTTFYQARPQWSKGNSVFVRRSWGKRWNEFRQPSHQPRV